MPIAQGNLLTRGNNNLLQGILDRTSVTFSQSLNNSFQAARDSVNLQASQGRDLLNTIRDIRNFEEDKFRDRRNFGENQSRDRRNFEEGQFRDRRDFTEGGRRFNASLSEQRAGRLQRKEIAFANLARQDRRLDQADDAFDLRVRDTNSVITARDQGTEQNRFELEQFKDSIKDKQDALDAFDTLNDRELFFSANPGSTEQDRLAALNDLNSFSLSRGFGNISTATGNEIPESIAIVQEPRRAEISDGASSSEDIARQSLFDGKPREAAIQAAEAENLAKRSGDTDLEARAKEIRRQAEEQITTEEKKEIDAAKNGKNSDPFVSLNFRNSSDALSTAFTIKEETGITDLSVTNQFTQFARRFRNVKEFRNGVLALAQREGVDVKITNEQATNLFNAETFLGRASTSDDPILENTNARKLIEGL